MFKMKRRLSINVRMWCLSSGYKNIKYIKSGKGGRRVASSGDCLTTHKNAKFRVMCLCLVEIAAELNAARLLAYPRVTDTLLFFIPLSLGTGSLIRPFSLIPTLICCSVAHHFINHISFANESVLWEYNKNGNKENMDISWCLRVGLRI